MEKARLIWKQRRYYATDLEHVVNKACKVFKVKNPKYSVLHKEKCINIEGIGVDGNPCQFYIPFDTLSSYGVGKPVEKYVYVAKNNGVKRKYTKSDLLQIGNMVARTWGGSCFNFEIEDGGKKVSFFCIEHGEPFEAALQEYEFFDAEYASIGILSN